MVFPRPGESSLNELLKTTFKQWVLRIVGNREKNPSEHERSKHGIEIWNEEWKMKKMKKWWATREGESHKGRRERLWGNDRNV